MDIEVGVTILGKEGPTQEEDLQSIQESVSIMSLLLRLLRMVGVQQDAGVIHIFSEPTSPGLFQRFRKIGEGYIVVRFFL